MFTKILSSKPPGAVVALTFNFAPLLGSATITGTPSCAVALDWPPTGGNDDSASLLQGTAIPLAGVVTQLCKTGTAMQDYRITCTALTSDGRTLVLAVILPVRAA